MEWVRSAAERFPQSEHFKLLVAFSHIDEITRDEEAQRTQIFSAEQREHLIASAEIPDKDWQARPWLLKSAFNDAAHKLAMSMIAHRLLHDRDTALARAERIADEAIDYPDILLNAVMVALSFDEVKLARRLIELAPDDPDLTYHAGVIAVGDGDWAKAATLFQRANVPSSEKRLTETAIALAPIINAGKGVADAATLDELMQETQDSPRGLILIAQVAAKLGLDELSEKALEAAVEAVPQDCHISTRLMVARYADRAGSPTTVIRLLDHHLPLDGFEREHERLAAAHANEHPHRQRNQRYFDSLPVKLRQRHGIARAHASLLLDVGRLAEASRLLRRLQADDPTDAFVTLRLIQSLRYSNEVASAEEFLRELDLQRLVGPPEYIIALAQLVLHAGCPERAYPVAYDLVRQHFDNGRVVLGYAAMGLQQDANGMFAMSVADIGAYVAIEAPDGIRQDFIIDECRDFFGIRVLPPGLGIAARVTGLRRGETFDLPKLGQDRPDTWTVTEVKSKYLHMHHRVLEEFETRFPDKPGIARFTVGDNIEAVLDVVRRSAEQNAENARL